MPKLPSKKPREILRFLQGKGFYIERQKGSHVILRTHIDSSKRVVIPLHNKDLKTGTLLAILKDAGINKNELSKQP